MSRVLPKFPNQPRRRSVPPKYNWELWLDGRVHALSADEYGDVYVFRNSAHSYCSRKGMQLRTVMVDGELVIQALCDVNRGSVRSA